MRRQSRPRGPTLNTGLRVPYQLAAQLEEVARDLNVTKANLMIAIIEHELSLGDRGLPTWWDAWMNRSNQEPLLESQESTVT